MTILDTTWVSTKDSFAALAAAWNSLAHRTDDKSVFLQHGWFAAAWQWRSHDCSLAILCVHRDNRVVGILPMVMERRRRRALTVRCLCSLDVPDTQQFSLLCAPEDAQVVAAAVVTELLRTDRSRDWLQLQKLHHTEANAALLQALQDRTRVSIAPADACLCVKLNDRWESYYSRRSRRLKKGNNLIANKLKDAFKAVEISRVTLGTAEAGEQVIKDLCELAQNSWKRDLATALHKPIPRSWAEQLRLRLGDTGVVCAWLLRLDGVLAAAELQLEYSGVVSALRADTREEYDKFGAGTYLGWKVLETLMGEPRVLYNMGPGLNEYKERWAEDRVSLTAVDWFSPTLTGQLLWTLDYRIKPLAKKIFASRSARTVEP